MSGVLVDGCGACDGSGVLVDQGYGEADELLLPDPPGGYTWVPVQRCDECQRWASDEDAARAIEPEAHVLALYHCPGVEALGPREGHDDWFVLIPQAEVGNKQPTRGTPFFVSEWTCPICGNIDEQRRMIHTAERGWVCRNAEGCARRMAGRAASLARNRAAQAARGDEPEVGS